MRNAISALTAITGSFIVMGAAASGAAAFYHSMIQEAQEPRHTIQTDITLVHIFDARTVHADITISAPDGEISLGGDISHILLYDGNDIIHGDWPYQGGLLPDGDHITIRYVGPLNMTRPAEAGDTVHVVINHRFGQDVIPVRIS